MALPGGRREPGDPDLVSTAIREIAEEVGITLESNQLLGRLADVVPRTPVLPPIAVRPFVFLLPAPPAITLSSEVASVHWIGLDDLMKPGIHHLVRLEVAGQSRDVAAYQLPDGIVWGMTERILTDLLAELSA